MYDAENIFSKILNKQIPADIIYENEYVVAFHDINPEAPIHILVIPKGQYIDYNDFILNADLTMIREFFTSISYITELLEIKDYRLITNKGADAGQTIFHFHIHILAGKVMTNFNL
jgi:histidine triad (HIT) family protein